MTTPAARYDALALALRQPALAAAAGGLQVDELLRCATLAASSHNTQPWTFRVRPDAIEILPDFGRRCPVVDPDDSHLFKSLGCAAENLVQAAAAQGHAASVRFDPGPDRVIVDLLADPAARAGELYRAIDRRQCVKSAYDGTPLDGAQLQALAAAGRGAGVDVVLLTGAAQKAAVIDFVTRGNRSQLTDPEFRAELLAWIRFNPGEALRTGDGLAGRTLGQPALPGWLARRLSGLLLTAERQVRTDAAHIASSAGVAVFVSVGDDKAAWVETGRACQRFMLQATALGVRTAFINQPIEVPALRPAFESWLDTGGRRAQLMLRFGHGPSAPFSLRRPVADVVVADGPGVRT